MTTLYVDGDSQPYEFYEGSFRVQVETPASDGIDLEECQECGEEREEEVHTFNTEEDCIEGFYREHHAFKAPAGPIFWANSAFLEFDEEKDSVTVGISIGDPRGAFVFTIRRLPAEADMAGRLIMHLPYPGSGWLHDTLSPLHEGTYLIGEPTADKLRGEAE